MMYAVQVASVERYPKWNALVQAPSKRGSQEHLGEQYSKRGLAKVGLNIDRGRLGWVEYHTLGKYTYHALRKHSH